VYVGVGGMFSLFDISKWTPTNKRFSEEKDQSIESFLDNLQNPVLDSDIYRYFKSAQKWNAPEFYFYFYFFFFRSLQLLLFVVLFLLISFLFFFLSSSFGLVLLVEVLVGVLA